jgi:aminobenzoyl-glutamate utilization protein B
MLPASRTSVCRPVPAVLLATLVLAAALPGAAAAQNIDRLRGQAWQEVADIEQELIGLSDALWRHAETSLLEVQSAEELASFLEQNGFTVERGVADMPTAFVASYGSGSPVIGILAEYDALPGISNQTVPSKTPEVEGAPGHGCGHNLFGAASAGAAVAAKEVLVRNRLPGTIKFFGCPAEETVIGKVYMAKAGVFDDLDACLDWHPGDTTGADYSRTRALNNFTVEFFGKTAHGAGDPWNGRSSLDAVELMNHAVNMLREHVNPSTRIHYVIADGGGAPNVVPDYARVWYYVRDLERDGVETTYEWVLKAAEGAAIATQTTHKVTLTTGVHSYLLNRPITELLDRNLRAAGAPEWTAQEQEFARAIQSETGKPEKGLYEGIGALPDEEIPAQGGSTDVAEISRIVPTAKFRVASSPVDAPWHAWPVVACGGTSIGHKAMVTAARTLSGATVELLVSPDVVRAAKEEFDQRMAGAVYRSPIPQDQKPPIPPQD